MSCIQIKQFLSEAKGLLFSDLNKVTVTMQRRCLNGPRGHFIAKLSVRLGSVLKSASQYSLMTVKTCFFVDVSLLPWCSKTGFKRLLVYFHDSSCTGRMLDWYFLNNLSLKKNYKCKIVE